MLVASAKPFHLGGTIPSTFNAAVTVYRKEASEALEHLSRAQATRRIDMCDDDIAAAMRMDDG